MGQASFPHSCRCRPSCRHDHPDQDPQQHPAQNLQRRVPDKFLEIDFGDFLIGNTVAVHIGRIREKLEDDPASPKLLQTVWGVGYRLRTDAV